MSETTLPRAGQRIQEYRLEQRLGRGRLGEVWQVVSVNNATGPALAIKLGTAKDPSLAGKFQSEALALSRLDHPNIVRLVDYNIRSLPPYYVMELTASNLAGRLWARRATPLPTILVYLEQLADTLDYAHSQDYVLRDFSPSKILLDSYHNPLLADFVRPSNSGWPLSAQGLEYAAPEQWEGQLTAASNVYSLAVLTCQLVSGRLPFEGNAGQLKQLHNSETPPKLRGLNSSPALVEAVSGGLAKNPADRPASVGAFYRLVKEAVKPAAAPSLFFFTRPRSLAEIARPALPDQAALQAKLAQSPIAAAPRPLQTTVRPKGLVKPRRKGWSKGTVLLFAALNALVVVIRIAVFPASEHYPKLNPALFATPPYYYQYLTPGAFPTILNDATARAYLSSYLTPVPSYSLPTSVPDYKATINYYLTPGSGLYYSSNECAYFLTPGATLNPGSFSRCFSTTPTPGRP